MKVIKIIVAPDGQTRLQTRGFTGGECRDASRLLEQALGERASEQLTGEFHQTQSEQNNLRQGA